VVPAVPMHGQPSAAPCRALSSLGCFDNNSAPNSVCYQMYGFIVDVFVISVLSAGVRRVGCAPAQAERAICPPYCLNIQAYVLRADQQFVRLARSNLRPRWRCHFHIFQGAVAVLCVVAAL